MSGFGNNPAQNTASNTTGAATPAGGTSGSGANIFGGAAFGGGLFGSAGSSNKPAGGGLFGLAPAAGNNAASGTSGNNIFAGGLFGAKPAGQGQSTAATPASGGTTGATPNLFGGTKPTDQAPAAAPKTSSNFFAQPSTSGSSTATPAGAPSGGLFGLAPKPADAPASTTAAATTTPAPAGSGFLGGGLFGAKPSTPAGSSSSAPAPASLPAFSLGGPASKDTAGSKEGEKDKDTSKSTPSSVPNFFAKPDDKKDAPAAPTVAPASSLFGSLAPAAPAEKKDTAPAASSMFSLVSVPKEGDKPKDASTTGAPTTSSTAIAVPPPSMLRGKTIEEVVNKWSTELDSHVREFNKFASEVAVWDRALIENGNNLAALYNLAVAAEQEQTDIDQSLDHIEQQQRELVRSLETYERTTEEVLGGQGSNMRALDTGPADTERDKNFTLATELHGHLDDLSGSLTQMIDAVNALTLPADGASQNHEDTLSQIGEILSSHLMSLLWIDGSVKEVESRINEVEKRVRLAEENGASSGFKARGFGSGGSR